MTEYVVKCERIGDWVYPCQSYGDAIPIDDTQEVVRCIDCKHVAGPTDISGNLVCKVPCGDATAGRAWVKPDGFCAWGERRGE